MRVRTYHLIAGLTSTCPQTEEKDHSFSLGLCVVRMLHPSAVIGGFIDHDYHYKSGAIQILYTHTHTHTCMQTYICPESDISGLLKNLKAEKIGLGTKLDRRVHILIIP